MSRTTTSSSKPSGVRITRRGDAVARRVATVAAVAALGGGVLTVAAAPVMASEGPQVSPLRSMCQADGGVFFPGRFGEWRCQRARTDGMGVFWAERTVCGQAGRLFLESVDESGETGSWVCSPGSV